jgi:hypothetical protein
VVHFEVKVVGGEKEEREEGEEQNWKWEKMKRDEKEKNWGTERKVGIYC